MPLIAFPNRYRPQYGPAQFVSPGVLTPLDDETSPAFDPSMEQSDSLQSPSPLPPPPQRIPKPPQDEDTQAGASLSKLPPLNPDAVAKSSMAGVKRLATMPPPGEAPAVNPPVNPPAPVASAPPNDDAGPEETAPVVSAKASKLPATQELEQQHANRPDAPKSNWAQRLGLAILSMTRMAPYANQIIHPKWSEQEAAYQGKLKDLESKQKEEETAMSTEALSSQRDATAQQKLNLAADYSAKEAERAQAVKDRVAAQTSERNRKFLADRLKGREADAVYQQQVAPRPPGYEFIDDPEKPGFGFAVPPAWRSAPQELLPFLPGAKEGDQIPHSEFKSATDALVKKNLEDTKAENRPDKLPASEYQGLLKQYTDPNGVTDYSAANKAWEAAQQKRAQAGRSVISLSSDSVDQNAQRYLQTGELPSLGMGTAGAEARQKILNRAAEMGHDGSSVSANKADYRAQSGSLAALQKNRDAVVAFENTAGKNLDLFLQKAKPIIDSGSQWINQPLRSIGKGGLGGADLAAYDAARQVALNEIAKVTSNPGLSGQLSDSARHEISTLLPESATLSQIYHVANVLKQDMANRHTSYDDQLKEIHGRLGGQQGKIIVAAPDGSVHPFDTQAQADEFKRLAHIQ